MDYSQLVATITPEIRDNMLKAVELGRWPNGDKVSEEQRAHCLQALIAYDELSGKPKSERIGYIASKEHDHCGSDESDSDAEWQPISFK